MSPTQKLQPTNSATPTLKALKQRIQELANPDDAVNLLRFFKTGPGEYGEGDRFLGIRVPQSRALAKEFRTLPLSEVKKLLHSEWHEERLISLYLLIEHFEKNSPDKQREIAEYYLSNAHRVNNWDLVDSSAHHLVGAWLPPESTSRLETLARSAMLWDRRIAVIATYWYIQRHIFAPTLKIAALLLKDPHDLMHKAVGWMLREVGKRDQKTEEIFLRKHFRIMPRTMLRYAIERFPEPLRLQYLNGTIE